mmetsp:Transcript_664/g.1591  ORF Transcript_664/g.1591 Transcript_664/m.1591 type:complete len:96 (-) Transcript_664:1953-2240(-)
MFSIMIVICPNSKPQRHSPAKKIKRNINNFLRNVCRKPTAVSTPKALLFYVDKYMIDCELECLLLPLMVEGRWLDCCVSVMHDDEREKSLPSVDE